MQYKYRKIIIFVTLITFSFSLAVDSNDLLSGNGLFLTQSIATFTTDPDHTNNFLTVNSSNVLKIQKPSTSTIGFSSGLQHSFTASTPKHITFEFSSASTETQDANLRLIDSTSDKTVLLFRAGKAGLIRVNENQMVQFYNNSVSTDSNVKMIKMDLLLNWETKKIDIFVGGLWKGQSKFFQQVASVNKVRFYNLYQSTSYWKNVAICSQKCYSFVFQKKLTFLIGLLLVIMILFN